MCAAATRRARQRFGRPMIDAVIEVFIGIGVGDPGEMDDGSALLEERLPVEWYRKIGKGKRDDVRIGEGGPRPGGGNDPVAPGGEMEHEMTPEEAAGAGHQHGFLIVHCFARSLSSMRRSDLRA